MPNYYEFPWEDFRVKAKPIGIRRLFRWLPYFTGSQPRFKVTIDTISGELRQLETTLELLEPDQSSLETLKNLSWYEMPIRHISEEVKFYPIGVSGDHRLQIVLKQKGAGFNKRDLVTFTAISGDRTTMTIFATLLVILGGILGGLIVRFLLGG